METDQQMSMGEIESQFDSEWVLIDEPELDEFNNVLSGRVRFHGEKRADAWAAFSAIGSPHIKAVLYIGAPPKDMQFML
ncbi:MAG: hypothetical protein ACI8UO_002718 [Verrucomicrobiales bacterium]|jgi:hypothetical protein